MRPAPHLYHKFARVNAKNESLEYEYVGFIFQSAKDCTKLNLTATYVNYYRLPLIKLKDLTR